MTRREVLAAMGGAAIEGIRQTTRVNFDVPAGACDGHVHIFEPLRFPFVADRTYTPGAATVGQLRALHAALGVGRVVVVRASVYGTEVTENMKIPPRGV